MPARIPDPTGRRGSVVISTGNGEFDRKIADGFPPGLLILVEGRNDTGKSVLIQKMVGGALKQELVVPFHNLEYNKVFQKDGVDEP